jgi:hypothetical protein
MDWKMRLNKLISLLFIASVGCTASGQHLIPTDLLSEITVARTNGVALYSEYLASHSVADADLGLVEDAKKMVKNFCDISYRAVTMNSKPEQTVYFIGEVAENDSIVFGRHFKVVGQNISQSTKACHVVQNQIPDGAEATGAFTSHILSETPNEFHVFLSLRHSIVIYVGTDYGIWKVSGNNVELVKRRN